MLIEDLASSPNPQFSRLNWVDLCGEWRFAFDYEDSGARERWFASVDRLDRTITVPYPPESPLSGIGDRSFHPIAWYARSFADTRSDPGERLLLHFGAVDYHATVWVDGVKVGEHRGGQTPFHFDVTDALDPAVGADAHSLVVRAKDDPVDVEQPRGKQDWLPEPHVIWYHRTSGIWQPVWTEVVPSLHILSVRWRFDRERYLVDYEIELSRPATATLTIELDVQDDVITTVSVSTADRVVAGQLHLGTGQRTMDRGQLIWSPGSPNLIGATLTLSDGEFQDVVQTYLGLRTIELSGRSFRINGRPTFLRFVLNQGYWPESQLTAPSPDALRREVELIKELGFNGARTHQKVEDPRFIYWADRLGLLLWGEIGNAFTFTERAIDRHLDEWREAVLRDRNHPSIIAWVPFNESWGVSELGISDAQQHAVKAAYYRTHMLDGTRPVIGNDGWENVIGDLVTIHDYSWDAEVLRERYTTEEQLETTFETFFPAARYIAIGDFETDGKPVMVTEFGGVSFEPDADSAWFGYGKVSNPEEFAAKYRELLQPLNDSKVICGFCYTQLADTEQEINGLLAEDRQPKVPFETLSKITRGESA